MYAPTVNSPNATPFYKTTSAPKLVGYCTTYVVEFGHDYVFPSSEFEPEQSPELPGMHDGLK